MGPNRQRKPANASRGRGGRGRGVPTALATKGMPSMISKAGKDLIIDVLQHAATQGGVPVPQKHFETNAGSRITFQRNTPLTHIESLQRLFEGLGFPCDLVAQYLTDVAHCAQLPVFGTITELLLEDGPFQSFLVQSCLELFRCMVWFTRDGGDGGAGPVVDDADLEEEMQTLRSLFSDSLLVTSHFGEDNDDGQQPGTGDREIFFNFRCSDESPVLVAIRVPEGYPAEPPLVYLQPFRVASRESAPKLYVAPSCTKELTAAARRSVIDAAVEAINGFVGVGCLMPLVSAVGGAISLISPPCNAIETPQNTKEVTGHRETQVQQRTAFLDALTGKGPRGSDADQPSGATRIAMPEKVELQTVERNAMSDTGPTRREFCVRNSQQDSALHAAWSTLQKEGSLSASRTKLPAFQKREELRRALETSNVVVIGGETGSGKTTQIPQFLYEFMCEEGRGSAAQIVCTQPRRLAATSVALRVAEERDEAVGGTVGYTIRLESCTSRKTQLLYCTTGIVLRRLQTDKFLGNVSHVVVDEIHERGVDTDFLLILLRDLLTRRDDLKVVLMSATMDSDLFSRYFGGAPIISIEGRTFPVKVMHLEEIIPEVQYHLEDGSPYGKPIANREARRRNTRKNVLSLGMDEVEDEAELREKQQEVARTVHATAHTIETLSRMNLDVINYELIEAIVVYIDTTLAIPGAVLIFLPGMAEIQACMGQLKSNPALEASCIFYNLHSSLGSAEQQGVFRRPPRGVRKIVLGTNLMETSITIDDAVFVIDSGKAKENRYNARKSLSQLVTVNISKANCRQRQGRAGRVREGFCFRLFTEAQYSAMDDHQLCEMHRVPLESLILQIYALHLGDEVAYLQKALTPPEEKAIHNSVKVLTALGALTQEKRLTSLGQHLANLPLDVRVGKMIIHGALLHCVDPVLTIAACLATRSPFITSMDFKTEVEGMRRAFAGEYHSDQLASWFAYSKWVSVLTQKGPAAARRVCGDCFLSPAALTQIQTTKMQYERYLFEAGFVEESGERQQSGRRFVFAPFTTLEGTVYEAGGERFNANSSSSRCILACLVAGLYPNIARVKHTGSKGGQRQWPGKNVSITTFDGSDCLIHPSSVAGRMTHFPLQQLVYVDKVKTSATFLREVSLVTPLQVVLFSGGLMEYLRKYEELCVDDSTAFKCSEEDATLLIHLKAQLDSALRQKINDPGRSWESVSSVVVRAITKLLRDDTISSQSLTIIDRRQQRAPLTEPLVAVQDSSNTTSTPNGQPFKTNKVCHVCGEVGHVSSYCPHSTRQNKGGPPVRCFICGQWHFPLDCQVVAPLKR